MCQLFIPSLIPNPLFFHSFWLFIMSFITSSRAYSDLPFFPSPIHYCITCYVSSVPSFSFTLAIYRVFYHYIFLSTVLSFIHLLFSSYSILHSYLILSSFIYSLCSLQQQAAGETCKEAGGQCLGDKRAQVCYQYLDSSLSCEEGKVCCTRKGKCDGCHVLFDASCIWIRLYCNPFNTMRHFYH